jgi:hypothetical protein
MKFLLVMLLACAGCRTTATNAVASAPSPRIRVGTYARTWEVRSGGEPLGLVVLFQEHGRARDSLYVVRNPWQQDLGVIDGLGRAYRYLPHCEDPVWVGSGTIAAGAREILGAEADCELIELAEVLADHSTEPVARLADAPPSDGGLPQSR